MILLQKGRYGSKVQRTAAAVFVMAFWATAFYTAFTQGRTVLHGVWWFWCLIFWRPPLWVAIFEMSIFGAPRHKHPVALNQFPPLLVFASIWITSMCCKLVNYFQGDRWSHILVWSMVVTMIFCMVKLCLMLTEAVQCSAGLLRHWANVPLTGIAMMPLMWHFVGGGFSAVHGILAYIVYLCNLPVEDHVLLYDIGLPAVYAAVMMFIPWWLRLLLFILLDAFIAVMFWSFRRMKGEPGALLSAAPHHICSPTME